MDKFIIVGDKHRMPKLAIGTWQACGNDAIKTVETAIKAGIRHIDTAAVYNNEKEVGQALTKVLNEGRIKREELFITTKLWCTMWGDVEAACRQSLSDLGLNYVDMYLVHVPVSMEKMHEGNKPTGDAASPKDDKGFLKRGNVPIHEMWRQMEALVHKGLVRAIGVSNWSVPLLADMMTWARIKPSVLQVEINPYFGNTRLIQFAQEACGIPVTAYSPFGHGQSPAPTDDAVIKTIGKKYNKTNPQVVIRWLLQRGVHGVIFKSTNEAHIKEGTDVWDWQLSEEDMRKIETLNRERRAVDLSLYHSIPLYD